MPPTKLPSPQITISKTIARRFMLSHHKLWPPRQLEGIAGIMTYLHHVGCIQFDPINIVGRNPDLVLQSRIFNYRPEFLDQLLYQARTLIDGWDKMASIYATSDWPYFSYQRGYLRKNPDPRKPSSTILRQTQEYIKRRGPISSLDLKEDDKVEWHWGPTKAGRAAMEYLNSRGYLGVHHRVNNRRYFDLIENLLPPDLLNAPDPFEKVEDYQDWHVLRRVGSLGLAQINSSEAWGGILGVKANERRHSINRLFSNGHVIPIAIDVNSDIPLFIRAIDLPILENIQSQGAFKNGAALIAPLDNLLWNRRFIESIFNFNYRWEVYKPKKQRQYGYYVLPVLYGDTFIGRVDPLFDKKKRLLTIQNWWWEPDIKSSENIQSTLLECFNKFCQYLGVEKVVLADHISDDPALSWMLNLVKIFS